MMLVQFEPYGLGERIYVNTERITYVEPYSSNASTGSMLHLDDGTQVLVGNYPNEVADKINAK
ncbi:hypothetical protein CEX98_17645 [Pseudoalteromonas piscicida]|uniref:Uncharacterized protein n=2 Tax=Pseudoalteromonas piscicida TaxID=43662 RepID=A0A2A5JM93_PSEO7|nr:hypothetical protein CEX98_17645 [Pseudoalteromonas piscicida]